MPTPETHDIFPEHPAPPDPHHWSDEMISDYYDRHLNLTMGELARMTGKSTPELKRILMEG